MKYIEVIRSIDQLQATYISGSSKRKAKNIQQRVFVSSHLPNYQSAGTLK
jgi:hypothetical protein